jgi:hypothetical protein
MAKTMHVYRSTPTLPLNQKTEKMSYELKEKDK